MKKIVLLTLIICCSSVFSQINKNNMYGLAVVSDSALYMESVKSDSGKLLVDLEDYIPGAVFDIRYASENNFYGEPVYETPKAFLRMAAADSLTKVQNELLRTGKGLKIFDAYRPYSVTVLFYEKFKDTNFVASAWTGSRHNRGCAIDLTIIDKQTGQEIRMPTAYDDFTERAAIDYQNVTEEEKKNRELLQKLMIKYGFSPLKSEWWHFDFNGWKNYEITDLGFMQLENIYKNFKIRN